MRAFRGGHSEIIKRCERAKGMLLLFDFDGTLSAIVPHPSKAAFLPGWKKRLAKLNHQENIKVGIVTGRSLDDIRTRVGIPGIIYAASHGYDINNGSRSLLRLGRKHRRPLRALTRDLTAALKTIPGTQVEYKGCAMAVHYRRVGVHLHARVKRIVHDIASPRLVEHGWQLTGGKMVLEVRPALAWNKGRAVQWILKKVAPSFLPCYIGDDVTDEDAFRALKNRGITIRIGKKKDSQAEYYVRHIDELIPWLMELKK